MIWFFALMLAAVVGIAIGFGTMLTGKSVPRRIGGGALALLCCIGLLAVRRYGSVVLEPSKAILPNRVLEEGFYWSEERPEPFSPEASGFLVVEDVCTAKVWYEVREPKLLTRAYREIQIARGFDAWLEDGLRLALGRKEGRSERLQEYLKSLKDYGIRLQLDVYSLSLEGTYTTDSS